MSKKTSSSSWTSTRRSNQKRGGPVPGEIHSLAPSGFNSRPRNHSQSNTMPVTTTPVQRIARMMREGARLVAIQPGQTSIDVTPDVIAMVDGSNAVLSGATGSNPVQTPEADPC